GAAGSRTTAQSAGHSKQSYAAIGVARAGRRHGHEGVVQCATPGEEAGREEEVSGEAHQTNMDKSRNHGAQGPQGRAGVHTPSTVPALPARGHEDGKDSSPGWGEGGRGGALCLGWRKRWDGERCVVK